MASESFIYTRFFCIIALLACVLPLHAEDQDTPYSLQITRSEMRRCPKGSGLDYVYSKKWQYSVFTELEAMINAAENGPDEDSGDVIDYALDCLDQLVDANGKIYNYKMSDYNLDHVKGGTMLLYAYERTGEKKYLTAANTLWQQLKGQPTTSDGGYWHKNVYPYQMWLDGLFMAEPFAAQYAARFLSDQEQEDAFSHIVMQFTLATTHTFDPATGLYRHGWDEKRVQSWADKTTGQSSHAWGRAMGWTFMAIPYVLDEMPADHPKRVELEGLFRTMANAIVYAQDAESGLWWQVLDCPGKKGNYLEATASAMFTYTLLRGVRIGILDNASLSAALKGWEGINDELVVKGADGSVTLTQCCSVGGLGGSGNRNGSFEYYISEPIRDNDGKGMGPFINAAVEIEHLKKNPPTNVEFTEADAGALTIYNLQGIRLQSNDLLSLPHGLYLLKRGNKTLKIKL